MAAVAEQGRGKKSNHKVVTAVIGWPVIKKAKCATLGIFGLEKHPKIFS
jgi:hypothetical protein